MCRSQIACGLADPDAGCATIGANSRLARTIDPCPEALIAALDAGSVRYDGQAAARCLEDQQTLCEVRLEACPGAAVFVGTRAEGASCALDQECSAGLWCSFSGTTCPGTCQKHAALGDVTTEPSACATETVLQLDGGSFRCINRLGAGQPCDPQSGAICSEGLSCEERACVPVAELGAACSATRRCRYGLVCVADRCATFARRGEPCSRLFASNPSTSPCQLGLACRGGRCGEAFRAGERCAEDPNLCTPDSRCTSDTWVCTPRAAAGAACESDFDCLAPLACAASSAGGGTCQAVAAVGESCDATIRCGPFGQCLNNRCVTTARVCR